MPEVNAVEHVAPHVIPDGLLDIVPPPPLVRDKVYVFLLKVAPMGRVFLVVWLGLPAAALVVTR